MHSVVQTLNHTPHTTLQDIEADTEWLKKCGSEARAVKKSLMQQHHPELVSEFLQKQKSGATKQTQANKKKAAAKVCVACLIPKPYNRTSCLHGMLCCSTAKVLTASYIGCCILLLLLRLFVLLFLLLSLGVCCFQRCLGCCRRVEKVLSRAVLLSAGLRAASSTAIYICTYASSVCWPQKPFHLHNLQAQTH